MAKKKNGKPKRSKPRPPRNRALPGMEQARHNVLDSVCEAIAKERKKKAKIVNIEKEELKRAKKYMEQENVTVYRRDGVELAVIPGESKVRARLVGEKTADDDAAAEDAAGDGEGSEE